MKRSPAFAVSVVAGSTCSACAMLAAPEVKMIGPYSDPPDTPPTKIWLFVLRERNQQLGRDERISQTAVTAAGPRERCNRAEEARCLVALVQLTEMLLGHGDK